jgi:hypothetical protein
MTNAALRGILFFQRHCLFVPHFAFSASGHQPGSFAAAS